MSTTTAPTHEAEATPIGIPVVAESQMIIDLPPARHLYIAVPDDLPAHAVRSEGMQALCRIDGGELMTEFTEHMMTLLAAVHTLQRKGTLTIKLKASPNGANRVAIEYDVDSKPPKEKRNPAPHFFTAKGQLVNRDPDQREMEEIVQHVAPKVAPPPQTVTPPRVVQVVAPPQAPRPVNVATPQPAPSPQPQVIHVAPPPGSDGGTAVPHGHTAPPGSLSAAAA